MISHHHKCIFVHIPKTAGQSIEHFFLGQLELDWKRRAPLLLRINDVPELGPPRLAHLKAREYLKYKYVSNEQFDTYFKFGFVRNPWDRLVSTYKHFKLNHVYDFKTFLMKKFMNGIYRKHYWFVCPQSEYLCDDNGELVVDYVGRFERLQDDFADVCDKINVPYSPLPHINKAGSPMNYSNHPKLVLYYIFWLIYGKYHIPTYSSYNQYYDNESKEFVEEIYGSDIRIFGYHFPDNPA